MAREHARILCSVWSPGDDFRDRSPEAQRLYFLLLSQRELNNAGVLPVMMGKWARCSRGTTVEDIEKALSELVEHRYVVVDEETEELLVRSFVRNDGIAKQPNVLTNALRLARHIESRLLRAELAREFVRIGHARTIEAAFELDPEAARELIGQPSPTGSANPSLQGVATPSDEPSENPTSSPAGWGGGRGRGRGTSEGGQVGETPARPSERCRRHADVEADGPCGGCGAARKAAERWDAEQVDPATAERARRRELIEACGRCDDRGMREVGDDRRPARCDHQLTAAAS